MSILWKKISFEQESGEFQRTALEFNNDNNYLLSELQFLQEKYLSAKLYVLNDSDWKSMCNTDSWKITNLNHIKTAMRRNKEQRNIRVICNEYNNGYGRSPIAIRLANNKLYLIAGNTRLMVAKMLKIRPKICIINTNW